MPFYPAAPPEQAPTSDAPAKPAIFGAKPAEEEKQPAAPAAPPASARRTAWTASASSPSPCSTMGLNQGLGLGFQNLGLGSGLEGLRAWKKSEFRV